MSTPTPSRAEELAESLIAELWTLNIITRWGDLKKSVSTITPLLEPLVKKVEMLRLKFDSAAFAAKQAQMGYRELQAQLSEATEALEKQRTTLQTSLEMMDQIAAITALPEEDDFLSEVSEFGDRAKKFKRVIKKALASADKVLEEKS